jgi:hypothetical protein
MDEPVNIPALLLFSEGGDAVSRFKRAMVCTFPVSRNGLGKSGPTISRDCEEMKP